MNKMKQLLLMLLLCLVSTSQTCAQKLRVESFALALDDLTAKAKPRLDVNNKECAVVKVQVPLKNVKFDGTIVGDVVYYVGEYWVYMPVRSCYLRIHHEDYTPLNVVFEDYGIRQLECGTTYTLTLAKPEIAVQQPQQQNLTIRYSPSSAMVLIDSKPIHGTNGVAMTTLPIGPHTFLVACEGYASEEGTVKLKDSAPSTLQIALTRESDNGNGHAAAQSSALGEGGAAVSSATSNVPSSPVGNRTSQSSYVSSSPFPTGNIVTIPVKNGISIDMVRIKAGVFKMGDEKSKTFHVVTLTDDYYMGKYEVTQALWNVVMGYNPSRFKGDNLPVEMVSWKDCQEFIDKLNSLTGYRFRLPTEAEWEYAACGGNKSHGYKYSGSNKIREIAWFTGNSRERTHVVGTKLPNELGLYDMSGNVAEWCQDWFGGYQDERMNPVGPQNGYYRVIRGGCWNDFSDTCISSYRSYNSPGQCSGYLGLRLALSE